MVQDLWKKENHENSPKFYNIIRKNSTSSSEKEKEHTEGEKEHETEENLPEATNILPSPTFRSGFTTASKLWQPSVQVGRSRKKSHTTSTSEPKNNSEETEVKYKELLEKTLTTYLPFIKNCTITVADVYINELEEQEAVLKASAHLEKLNTASATEATKEALR